MNKARKTRVTMQVEPYNRFKDLCKHNCCNRKLKLAGMALGPIAATELLDMIASGAEVAQLMLRKNQLGDKGIQILSQCLSTTPNEFETGGPGKLNKSLDLILVESQHSATVEADSI